MVNNSEKIVMAIDLGGTKIKMGLVRGNSILTTGELDANSKFGLKERLPEIKDCMDNLLTNKSISLSQVFGVGISSPGIVDSINKRILSIDKKYSDAPGIDLTAWVKESWGLPLALENDARAALIGEWQYGKGTGYDNVVMMTLGTGIGTSAVIEGKVLRGKHFQAGILGGHFTVNTKGGQCNCGNYGCVEVEASTWNLQKLVTAHPDFSQSVLGVQVKLDFQTIFRCAENQDELAMKVRDECLDVWSACAINLIHAYDPELLILSGGIMASGDYILPYIQNKINQNAWTPWGKVKVCKAEFANTAALLGASYLVLNS